MPLFSRNSNSRSNSAQSSAGSQHLIQPQSTYKRFKISAARLFHRSRHNDPAIQVPAVDKTALMIQQAVSDGHDQQVSVDITNDVSRAHGAPHHASLNPATMQAEGHESFPHITESVMAPVTTQLQDAHSVNISGNPQFTNIGVNHSVNHNVNFYGGTHGLENLKEFVSFAALHDSAEQDPKRRCHPGTRMNVLSQLRDWFDNPNATERICWLHGPAGAGKSAIAQTIAHGYEDGEVAATFFFYRSDRSRSDGNRLFPTIVWQLAFLIPAIKDFIVHALDKTPHLPRKDVETQFKQLVAYPFQQTNFIASQMLQPPPVVIIDGFDECSDEELQRRILNVIGKAVKDCLVPLRFFICSRPEALIEEVLDQFKDITLRIDLATLDDSNRDIEKYLIDQFSDIRSKRSLASTWPGPKTIEEFVFKSSGNFIFAATVMRYIGDEDCDPEEQLDIVRNLKPQGRMSPFALLDELYLEISKRQRDQDFLKAFLTLFVARSSIHTEDLHEDDAMLMNVPETKLHMKLRRMRSLFKFEPFIDVHHKSFLDFLQDLSRSGEYHVSRQGGQKRYLELIVESVVRHISIAIEQPNSHEGCRSTPMYRDIVKGYPPTIVLLVEDWQETLRPLLCLQDRLLNTLLRPQLCGFSQVMRELLLHLMILERNPHHSVAMRVLDSNMNETVTEQSSTLVTVAGQNMFENDLDRCLYALLSSIQKTDPVLAVDSDRLIIECMASLLAFDYVEIAARVRSVVEAQKLVDIIDLLIHKQTFLTHCDRDVACTVALLASEVYSRVPVLPRSVFLNGPSQQCHWLLEMEDLNNLELACQSMFITRILDNNYTIPSLWMYQGDESKFVYGSVNEQDETVDKWLKRSKPNFVTRIRVMLEIGRAIRYIHSMNVIAMPYSGWIKSDRFGLDLNLRAKIMFHGYFTCQVREYLIHDDVELSDSADYTPEANIAAFADIFDEVCFDDDDENHLNPLVEDVKQLIERCRAEDPKNRPTMEDVVKEMETWNVI